MHIEDLFLEQSVLSFLIDENYVIQNVSSNVKVKEGQFQFKGKVIFEVMEDLFCNERFKNENYLEEITSKIIKSFSDYTPIVNHITLTNDLDNSDFFYRFSLGIDVYSNETIQGVVKFVDFSINDKKDVFYNSVFEDYGEYFLGLNDLLQYGKFIVDYSVSKNRLYGSKEIPNLLNIERTIDNTYSVSRYNKQKKNGSIVMDEVFFDSLDRLLKGDTSYITYEFVVDNKHLRLEAKVLKYDENNAPYILGGVLYNVTRYRNYDEVYHMKSIYELAINVGGIGIFYYDFEKYGKDMFEANNVYGDLLGIKPNKLGLYNYDDFVSSILETEEEFSKNLSTLNTVRNLFEGKIESVTDDIIKVKNHVTDKELYLLSSSRIETRFQDGSPKRFGGIVIDITDRIENEKNKLAFAYTDELTRLPNKRKLMVDLKSKEEGIGLFFDLDNFKKINDEHGHSVGDEALQIYSKALLRAAAMYRGVTPYRLYGDEFFVFIEGIQEDIVSDLRKEIDSICLNSLQDRKIILKSSMGMSCLYSGDDLDDFIKKADYKMYEEKLTKKRDQ